MHVGWCSAQVGSQVGSQVEKETGQSRQLASWACEWLGLDRRGREKVSRTDCPWIPFAFRCIFDNRFGSYVRSVADNLVQSFDKSHLSIFGPCGGLLWILVSPKEVTKGLCPGKESEPNRGLSGCSSSASLVALLESQPAQDFVGQLNTLLAPEFLPATLRIPTAFSGSQGDECSEGRNSLMRSFSRSKSLSKTSSLSPQASAVAAIPASKNFICWPRVFNSEINDAN